jgi:hypothetical protein
MAGDQFPSSLIQSSHFASPAGPLPELCPGRLVTTTPALSPSPRSAATSCATPPAGRSSFPCDRRGIAAVKSNYGDAHSTWRQHGVLLSQIAFARLSHCFGRPGPPPPAYALGTPLRADRFPGATLLVILDLRSEPSPRSGCRRG